MPTFIRILPKRHYYADLGRFSSLAFKKHQGGISVILKKCVSDLNTQLCLHLKEHYSSVDSPPHILWIFDGEILPIDCQIIQEDSPTGDICHYNITNISKGTAKRVFNEYFQSPLMNGHICDNHLPRPFEQCDLSILEKNIQE